jgi:hypothetical protein
MISSVEKPQTYVLHCKKVRFLPLALLNIRVLIRRSHYVRETLLHSMKNDK